jgi:hypothetical protein
LPSSGEEIVFAMKGIAWSIGIFIGVGAIGVMIERIVKSITSRLDAIKEQLKLINEELRRREREDERRKLRKMLASMSEEELREYGWEGKRLDEILLDPPGTQI